MTSSTFRLGEEAIRVSTSEVAIFGWLDEFFRGTFDGEAASATTLNEVKVDVDADRYHALLALLRRAAPREVELFTLDGSFISAPLVVDVDGRRWAHREESKVFVGADTTGRDVEVVLEEAWGKGRGEVMRVVREIGTASLLRSGWLPLHASGFVGDGGVTLLCGAKRSGKTSLLVHALNDGAQYLSNDRVFVAPGSAPGSRIARGMPTIVMIRRGTLERFGDLQRRYDERRFTWTRTIAECAPSVEREAPRSSDPEKLPGLSPAQLAAVVNTGLSGPAPVTRLVFPVIQPDERALVLEPLGRSDALPRLLESLLTPSRPTRTGALFTREGERLEVPVDVERERARSLLESCEAIACRIGSDAYARPFSTCTFPKRSP